jgi:hypothetical protein
VIAVFGSGFSFGFTLADVQTQISGFLGNAVVLGLVTASIALVWALRLIRAAKAVGRR